MDNTMNTRTSLQGNWDIWTARHPATHSSTSDTDNSIVSALIKSRIGVIELFMLCMMWGLSLMASVKSLGILGGGVFLFLAVVLTVKKASNSILVLLVLFYSPATALQIPNMFAICCAIAFFGCLIHGNLAQIIRLPGMAFFFLAVSFCAWSLLTTLFAMDFEVALRYWMQYCHGILLLVLVIMALKNPQDCGRVLKWWAIIAALSLLAACVHYVSGENTFLYNMLKHVKSNNGYSAVTSMTIGIGYNEATGRLIWPGLGPNYHSANLIFPFGLALAFYDAGNIFKKALWLVILIMIGSAVVGTFSRSGFISISMVSIMYLLLRNVRAVVPAMALGAVVLVLFLVLPQLVLRISGIGDAMAQGATGRFTAWQYALSMWFESPIWGKGLGSYFAAYGGVAHNTYLTILCETGLIGLILYSGVIFSSIKNCLSIKTVSRKLSSMESGFFRTIVVSLGGMCMMIGTISYEEVKLFWMACGILSAMYYAIKLQQGEQPVS